MDPKPNAEEHACFTSVHDVKLSRTKPGNVDVPNNNSSSHKPAAQSSTPATNTKPVVDKPSPCSTFILLNAQGISPLATSCQRWKIPFLTDTLNESGSGFIPFISITESWLKSYVTDSQIAIDGYTSLRSDREKIQRGGVVLYVHDSLPVSNVTAYDDGTCEAVMGTLSSIDTILVNVYRPPTATDEKFTQLLGDVQQYLDITTRSKHHDIYITGDFNLPVIDWLSHTTDHSQGIQRGTEPAQRLLDFRGTNFLTQVVTKPTRESNILDLVLTNCPQYVTEVKCEDTPLSDHDIVTVTTGFDWRPTRQGQGAALPEDPFSFRSINHYEGDFEKMNEDLQKVNWQELAELCHQEEDDDGTQFMELLRLTVLQTALKHCPKRKLFPPSSCGPKKPKSRERQVLKRKRRKLKARVKALEEKQPNSPAIQDIKDEISLLCIDIRDAIHSELNRRELKAVATVKTNPRFFFSYAKKYSKLRSNVGPLRNSNNDLENNPKVMADILQRQYVSVFSDPSNPNLGVTLE